MEIPTLPAFPTRSRRDALAALTALAGATVAPRASAQADAYPSRPIRFVVGYPPGGSVDATARILAEPFGQAIGASIVVENQGGAAGVVAAQRVVGSPPDGYTLLVGSSNELVGTGVVNPAQKYDARRDLTPIGLIGIGPSLLVAGPRTGVRTLAQFVDTVKSNPGKFSYGSSGVGSTLHFIGELIKYRSGLFIVHIPYRGVAPLASDLLGGVMEFAIMSPAGAAPFLKDGRLFALGVSSASRLPSLPQVPTFGEHPALKGAELDGWMALVGPKGLPQPVLERLRGALAGSLKQPATRRRYEDIGMIASGERDDLAKRIDADVALYNKLADFAKMRD